MPLETPDHDTIERVLADSPLSSGAAEAHGIYCGLLAADAPQPRERWLAELLPAADSDANGTAEDLGPTEGRRALAALADSTRAQMQGPTMSLDLLLPPAGRSLRERAVAVHDWARGFLFGLGLAQVDPRAWSAQNREVFDDFVELTRMDLDDLDDDEANETALADIIELVRVAALLVYEDRCGRRTS